MNTDRSMLRRPALRRAVPPGVLALCTAIACGPRVVAVETARQGERDPDAEVLVFVRDSDGIPSCPWEVLGTVEVEPGWPDDPGERRQVLRAAARLGGHAVLAETPSDAEARIVRFFDPLCNPVED